MPSDGNEDVVERRFLNLDGVNFDLRLVERANNRRDRPRTKRGANSQPAGFTVTDGAVHGQQVPRALALRLIYQLDVKAGLADKAPKFLRCALGDDLAVVDNSNAIGQLLSLFEVLRCKEDRRPLVVQLAQFGPQRRTADRIEPGCWLIEEKHVRPVNERHCEVEAAAHAAGIGIQQALGRSDEVDALEQLLCAELRFRPPEPMESALQLKQLAPSHQRVKCGLLQSDSNRATHLRGLFDDVVPGNARVAARGAKQSRKNPYRRRFARAIRPKEAIDLPGGDCQVNAVDGAKPARIDPFQAFNEDRRVSASGSILSRNHAEDPSRGSLRAILTRAYSNISDILPRRAKINDVSLPYRSGSLYILIVATVLTALLCAVAVIASEPFVVPSVGPTIFIIVAFPLSDQAHPRNILFATAATIVAGIIGLALFGLIDVPPDLTDLTWTRSGALIVAVALGIAGIILLRALHVPAVATAMIIAAGLLKDPSDWLAVFVGVLVVTVAGFAINRACGKPQAVWWRPQPPGQ